jgi:hypothetical protein
MLDFVRTGLRPFEVLGGDLIATARAEIASKFSSEIAKDATKKRCHETIALPLKEALDSGLKPELLHSHWTSGGEVFFVKLGSRVFPIKAGEGGWGKKSVSILEPLSSSQVDKKKLTGEGLEGFYSKKDKFDSVTLFRSSGPSTNIQWNDSQVSLDQSYAWALWEAALAAVRLAHHAERAKDKLEKSVTSPYGSAERTIADVLPALLSGTGTAEASGPPLGHDLLDAFSWNGRPVAITSDRRGDRAVSVFVLDKVGQERAWIELPFPSGTSGVPCRGVSALLSGDRLRLFGGVDQNGVVLKSEWSYDLWSGSKMAWSSDPWKKGGSLPDSTALAVAAMTSKETLIVGGVAGYYVKGGEKSLDSRRGMVAESKSWSAPWTTRAAAPGDVTGASSVVTKDVLIIGPGSARDGKLYAYDASSGGSWSKLPELPIQVGLGQVHAAGDTLYYTGGFFSDGKPSKAIYSLDLAELSPAWKKLGESDYVAGRARLVQSNGHMISLLVSPKARITFHPGLAQKKVA